MEGTPFGIINDRLVLFVHLPKAGGTAIRHAYFTGHDNHKHMPMSAIKRKWPKLYARAYKIANVRDPIERTCSALRWIQSGAPRPDRLATKGMAPMQLFEYAFEQKRLTVPCARPLDYFLDLPTDLDAVIRQDHMLDDCNAVFGSLGCPERKNIPVVRKSERSETLSDYCPALQRKIVAHAEPQMKLYKELLRLNLIQARDANPGGN